MDMPQVSDVIRTFFKEFEQANNAFAPDRLASLVSDPLVGADPNGVVQAIAKEDYLSGIVQSQQYLQMLGFQYIKAVPIEEIQLSEHYVLVKTQGTMHIEKTPGQPIDLVHNAAYILFVKDGKAQIVFSLTHEDPMKMLQEQYGISLENLT
ncbi:hypothetical protein EPA93_34730 [Ktedonosporobacter rubrisoli]|uniref:Nuclear transport factor 2 family protein n=1 Tax=Ktedonosporobacter rubrisoli TaxID=2509675 RepID=A0A4P6JYH6_KTERU|nr:hypothetical protein [Ktedonosporobacter rubrisoli]QBD80849.1 hypothetical protein EPA93_34730 [Ktedonosporobacter rubrisoli]